MCVLLIANAGISASIYLLLSEIGKIEKDEEVLMMVKTRASLVGRLTKFIEGAHPYDCPEVITMKIQEGRKEYLAWIAQNTL